MDRRLMLGGTLEQKEYDVLFTCLRKKDEKVIDAALLIITESDHDILQRLIKEFDTVNKTARLLALTYLASTDSAECYLFLLDRLKN